MVKLTLFTQNAKMKKSQNNEIALYNFGIPAVKTCPMAGPCKIGCYANAKNGGSYAFKNSVKAYSRRHRLTKSKYFSHFITLELNKIIKKSKTKQVVIRLHDSGDFYGALYRNKWFDVIKAYPNVKFYAYTKSIQLFKNLDNIPSNFNLTYSFGGKLDSWIDMSKDKHSLVFKNLTDLLNAGYVNASDDDLVTALGKSNKIGLVYHGSKKFENTDWMQVNPFYKYTFKAS